MANGARDLRREFLDYFDHKAHHVQASSPLIPQGDPSLLFTAAGMVPFKPYFLGVKTGTDRATSAQKCFRTTDIDNVGLTVRHLTFFEMLGNFSFGDYFKEEAIAFAWDFLTKKIGLDPKRLHPSVFRDDAEGEALWKKIAQNPVTRLDEKDNFWAMGETGPCGPCSEIYYDFGPGFGDGPEDTVGGDGDRYIELWNLVFMQFDRQPGGALKPLPKKNIDTGMGLERLTMVVEDKKTPFHTSLFLPVRDAVVSRLDPDPKDRNTELGLRIISDHTRAAVMLAFEGIIPSNVERGYVLRRLIRRASRYARLLGAKEPFLQSLVAPALDIYDSQYPELRAARRQIEDTLRAEEERFFETLERGEKELADLLGSSTKTLSGAEAFKLYDTYGFPLELTREICIARGVSVDETGFKSAQEKAVEVARSGWKGSGQASKAVYDTLLQDTPGLRTDFVGYGHLEKETRIAAILPAREGSDPGELAPGDQGEIVLKETPFYPEGGGQVGDSGALYDDVKDDRLLAQVHDTQKPRPGLIVHRVTAHRTLRLNMRVRARVDAQRRRTTAYHHTATHLLNEALKRVLGPTVRQAGSLVAPDRLRYDFTHGKPVSSEELLQVEAIVNEAIAADYPVSPKVQSADQIEALGATTLLGEDYGDKPRFLLIGTKGWDDPKDRFSLELCGGTHVENTGEIQRFKIVKESSVAAGIRRIEAVAGPALEDLQRAEEEKIREELREAIHNFIVITSKIQSVTGKPYRDVLRDIPDADSSPLEAIRRVLPELRDREKKISNELAQAKRSKLMQQADLGKVVLELGHLKLAVQKFDGTEAQALRGLADKFKRELGTGVVFLGSSDHKRLSFVVGVTQDLIGKGVDASAIAKAISEKQNGRGGGRRDFAQGGGPDYDWDELVEIVKKLVQKP